MLRERSIAAFDRAMMALGADPAAEPARALLSEQRGRLLSTLRVAVVGRVSSGKSTLVNALLGGYRVPTGATELTYNVNWLRYGEEPGILIHFRDGQPAERRELTDLERMTVRPATIASCGTSCPGSTTSRFGTRTRSSLIST